MILETHLPAKLTTEYVDKQNQLGLDALLYFSQEAAITAVEGDLGITRDKTMGRGLLWVLVRYHIEIDDLPILNDDLDVISWQSKMIAFFFQRHFEFFANGKKDPCIKGVTIWCMIDQNTRQVILPKKYGIEVPNYIRGDELDRPQSLHIEPGDQKTALRCEESDLDSNKHMNNVYYLSKCLKLIPDEYLKTHKIKTIDINYKKELRLGEETELTYSIKENECSFSSEHFELLLGFDKTF